MTQIKLPAGWRTLSDERLNFPRSKRDRRNFRGLDGKTDLEAAWDNLWLMHSLAGSLPVLEYQFAPPRKWKFDRAWPDRNVRVAVELDGGQHASRGGRHARDTDREKLNAATELGWRVFHFTKEMLEADGAACVAMVARALAGESQ